MKTVKPVQFPLQDFLRDLRESKPRYITQNGLRINILETAASLIESLIMERDEAAALWSEFAEIIGSLTPDVCRLADLTIAAHLNLGMTGDSGESGQHDSDDDRLPTAKVISALVKYEDG